MHYVHIFVLACRIDRFDYSLAMEVLEEIHNLKLSTQIIKKHPVICDIIKRATKYIGNKDISKLTEQEVNEYTEQLCNIRNKAQKVLIKFASYFTAPT